MSAVSQILAPTGTRPWAERAACKDKPPSMFFPKGRTGRHAQAFEKVIYRPARTVCAGCEVRSECLAWALDHDEPAGMWGGLTPSERQRWRR